MSAEKINTSQLQKLKLKMISIDSWSKREQLCLASSVLHSGDQNWVSVSRSLKPFAEPNRPEDWLSAKNCALQYNSLLEKAGAHKRKRGERHPSSGSSATQQGETPGEIILKQLNQERIEELEQMVKNIRNEYQKLKKETDLVQGGKMDDKLKLIYKKIDEEKICKEQEESTYLKWLEERERKMAERDQAIKQQMAIHRSPSKESRISQIVEIADQSTDASCGISPTLNDQLNIDVTAEEAAESSIEAQPTTSGASSSLLLGAGVPTSTPPPPPTTPSSPLLTSLLRSPTTSPMASKTTTKLSLSINSSSGLSSGLKNLLSTAIGDESNSKMPSVSPVGSGATAPTLTRLLELPLNALGKPLAELTTTEVIVDPEETSNAPCGVSQTEISALPALAASFPTVQETSASAFPNPSLFPSPANPQLSSALPPSPSSSVAPVPSISATSSLPAVSLIDSTPIPATGGTPPSTLSTPQPSLIPLPDSLSTAALCQISPIAPKVAISVDVSRNLELAVKEEKDGEGAEPLKVLKVQEPAGTKEPSTAIAEPKQEGLTSKDLEINDGMCFVVAPSNDPEISISPSNEAKAPATQKDEKIQETSGNQKIEGGEDANSVLCSATAEALPIDQVASTVAVKAEPDSIPAEPVSSVLGGKTDIEIGVQHGVGDQTISDLYETHEEAEVSTIVESEMESNVTVGTVPFKGAEEKLSECEFELTTEKVIGKSTDVDVNRSKPVEIGTPSLTRRPLRGAPRSRKTLATLEVTDTGVEEKTKSSDAGPSTRRSSGRKYLMDEMETNENNEETLDTLVPNIGMKKKPAPLPSLQAPMASPAPSSGIDSTPNSPTSSVSTVNDDDRDYRAWKKSILLTWREISSHKNASLFQKPITEEHAPGYRSLIFRPTDLSAIKKSIENGSTRTNTEFHRDVALMFLNSIFYNPCDNEVHRLAKEMLDESNSIIQEHFNAQLLAQSNEHMRPVRRETRDSTRRTESFSSSHEEAPTTCTSVGPSFPSTSKPEEGKTRAAKRASLAVITTPLDETKKRRSRNPIPE